MTRWDWVTTINRVTWVQANWNGKHKHKHHSVTALECSRACSESRIMSEIVETNRRTGGHAGRHWQSHTADQMVQKCEKHQKKSRQQWENWFLWRRMQLNYYNTRKTAAQLNHSKILVYNEQFSLKTIMLDERKGGSSLCGRLSWEMFAFVLFVAICINLYVR